MDDRLTLDGLAPRDVAVRQRGRTWSIADLQAEAESLRAAVSSAVAPGEIVEVPAPDPATALAFLEASWREGRVPAPRAAVAAPRRSEVGRPPDGAALVIRTSGSMGEPKHVAFGAAAILRSAAKIAARLGLASSDRVGIVQSLEQSYGLVGQLFSALAAGASVVWAAAPFPAEQVAALDGVTVISGVPYALGALVRAGLRGEHVRVVGSAGAPLGGATAELLRGALPRAVLWNQYGCTEAGPRLTACPSDDAAFERGSVGAPLDGVELRLSDDGEILFRSDTAMLGYVGDVASPGFLATGDLGRIEDGRLFVTGRRDDVVKLRGQKVALPLVARAAERCGARGAIAFAVTAAGRDEPEIVLVYEAEGDLARATLAKELPLECLPARLVRVAELPRLASGKIDRAAAATLAEGAVR